MNEFKSLIEDADYETALELLIDADRAKAKEILLANHVYAEELLENMQSGEVFCMPEEVKWMEQLMRDAEAGQSVTSSEYPSGSPDAVEQTGDVVPGYPAPKRVSGKKGITSADHTAEAVMMDAEAGENPRISDEAQHSLEHTGSGGNVGTTPADKRKNWLQRENELAAMPLGRLRVLAESDFHAKAIYGKKYLRSSSDEEIDRGIEVLESLTSALRPPYPESGEYYDELTECLSALGTAYRRRNRAEETFHCYSNLYELDPSQARGLIRCYEEGFGCKRDPAMADNIRSTAATRGGAYGKWGYALSLIRKGQRMTAAEVLQRAAIQLLETREDARYNKETTGENPRVLKHLIRIALSNLGESDEQGKSIVWADEIDSLYAQNPECLETVLKYYHAIRAVYSEPNRRQIYLLTQKMAQDGRASHRWNYAICLTGYGRYSEAAYQLKSVLCQVREFGKARDIMRGKARTLLADMGMTDEDGNPLYWEKEAAELYNINPMALHELYANSEKQESVQLLISRLQASQKEFGKDCERMTEDPGEEKTSRNTARNVNDIGSAEATHRMDSRNTKRRKKSRR